MRSAMGFLAVLFLLNGCLTGNMEKITTETKDTVKASNVLINETKEGQQTGLAVELMTNAHNSPNVRARGATVVFIKVPEDAVGNYLGLAGHIKMNVIPRVLEGKAVQFANVTIVGDQIDTELGVAPANADLYKIQSFAALSVLEQLSFQSKLPGLSAEDMDSLRTRTARMIYVAPSVLGGTSAEALKNALRTGSGRTYLSSEPVRKRAAQLISDLTRTLSLPEEQIAEARSVVEARLGVAAR